MGYKVFKLQNDPQTPTIVITNKHPNWEEIYQKWKDGKNPTDSKEWEKGVIAKTENLE